MIRESEYFEFAGRRSTEFGIRNVAISDGLYQESFMANREINEVQIRGRKKRYFFDITEDPLSFQVAFYFDYGWNDELINKVSKWLKQDYYQPLSFNNNWDKVYRVMFVDSSDLIHNGLKNGYITLNVRCDSPYVYSKEKVTKWYDCTYSPTTFEIMNLGHEDIYPFIYIEKIGDGDISISNLSRANSTMQLTSLEDGEKLLINGENQIIETNIPNTFRYDNSNDFYLPFYVGNNLIEVNGSCKLKFRYTYKFIS